MTAAAHPARRARVAVVVAFVAQGVCFASLVTRIPTLKDAFGIDEAALAGLLVLVPLVAGVGSVMAGHLAGGLGSRRALRILGPIVPLALVAVGLSTSIPMLVAALAVLGFGLGSVDATMNMQALDVQTAYRRPVMASFYALFSLATIVAAAIAAAAAATAISLGAYFLVLAAVVVPVQLAVGSWLLRGGVGEPGQPPGGTQGPARADSPVQTPADGSPVPWRPIVLIGLALTCVYVLDSAAANWSAVYFTDALGSGESVAALAYAGYALALLLGRSVADRAVLATGSVRLVRLGAALAAAAVLGVAIAPGEIAGLAAFAVLGLGVAPVIPLAFTAAGSHDPGHTGVAVARVNVFNYAGFVLGAPLVGLVADASSLRWGFAALAPMALLVIALAPAFAVDPAALARSSP